MGLFYFSSKHLFAFVHSFSAAVFVRALASWIGEKFSFEHYNKQMCTARWPMHTVTFIIFLMSNTTKPEACLSPTELDRQIRHSNASKWITVWLELIIARHTFNTKSYTHVSTILLVSNTWHHPGRNKLISHHSDEKEEKHFHGHNRLACGCVQAGQFM